MKSLIISKEDLKHNINIIKSIAEKSNCNIIGIVKGNGYGLGLIEYSKFLLQNRNIYYCSSNYRRSNSFAKIRNKARYINAFFNKSKRRLGNINKK